MRTLPLLWLRVRGQQNPQASFVRMARCLVLQISCQHFAELLRPRLCGFSSAKDPLLDTECGQAFAPLAQNMKSLGLLWLNPANPSVFRLRNDD